ncbi:hypothetical protein CsSME_00028080 [Camellia sinensis var. sinensis]
MIEGKTSFKGIESSSEATSDFPRQARVRASCVSAQSPTKFLDKHHNEAYPIKHAEGGWCDSPGIAKELKAKLQMRQEGAIKRERNNCTLPISTDDIRK